MFNLTALLSTPVTCECKLDAYSEMNINEKKMNTANNTAFLPT